MVLGGGVEKEKKKRILSDNTIHRFSITAAEHN